MKSLIGWMALAALVTVGCGGAQQSAVTSGTSALASLPDVEKKIGENCPATKVGPLPTDTPEKKAEFTDLIGKVLSGAMSKLAFVNQLTAKNPGSENAVKCAADQIPEQGLPAPTTPTTQPG